MFTNYFRKEKTTIINHILRKIHFFLKVWIALVASIVACIAFIKLIAIMITKYFQKPNGNDSRGFSNLGEIIEYVLATLTNQGNVK